MGAFPCRPRFDQAITALAFALLALPAPAAAQNAAAGSVRIRVTDAVSREGVPDARVAFPALGLEATTDGKGYATIEGISPGDHELEVTATGFRATALVLGFAPGQLVETTVELPVQPLEMQGIYVGARKQWSTTLESTGFEERRKLGFGRHLDRMAVRRRNAFRLDLALEDYLPRHCHPDHGPKPGKGAAATTLSQAEIIPTQAMGMGSNPILFVDGAPWNYQDIRDFPLDWVEGVEIYRNFAGLPSKYTGLAPCGAILVWTSR